MSASPIDLAERDSHAGSLKNWNAVCVTNCVFDADVSEMNVGNGCFYATAESLLKKNYTLRSNSPAIDQGADVTGMPSVDLAGNPRVIGAAIDLGCFEAPKPSGFRVILR